MPSQYNRICAYCSTPFYVRPSRPDKFCNQACYFQSLKGQRIARVCETCNADFETWPHVVTEGKGRFCSRECFKAHVKPALRSCQHCGADVNSWARNFCSHVCDELNRAKKNIETFWDRVIQTETCWEYQGAKDRHGYGMVSNGSKGAIFAHHLAWMMVFGPIPDGQYVLHHCDNPPCVRPEHLHLGSHAKNMEEASERQRFPLRARWREAHRGSGPRSVKLTADIVREIRARHALGNTSYVALGTEFGVHANTIWAVVSRNSWADIE